MPYKCPEKQKEYHKKYYQRNREKAAVDGKNRYINKRDEIREQHKIYYMKNKEILKIKSHDWYENNKDYALARQKLYLSLLIKNDPQKMKGKLKDVNRKNYLKHREKQLRESAKYKENNPEKVLAWSIYHREKYKKRSASLADRYINGLIMKRWSFNSRDEIPQSLIDFKRAEIKLKRAIKEIENNEKEC